MKYLDRYIYFDKDGTVVESSDVLTKGIPQVTGISFSGIQVGKPLTSEDTDIFLRTLESTSIMEDIFTLTAAISAWTRTEAKNTASQTERFA